MAADPQDPILSGMNPAEIDAVFRQSIGAKTKSAVPQAANEEPSIEDFNPSSIDKAFRQAAVQPATPKVKSIFKRALSGAGDVLRTAGQGAAAAADIPFETIPALVETTTYPAARALGQTPEQAQRTAGRVAGTAASYFAQPFGKAFGVTETPGYKGMGFAEFVAKYADKGANWISQQTGAPAEDVKNVMAQLGFVAGGPAGEVAGAAGRAVGGALKREAGYVAGAVQPAVEAVKAVVPSRRKPEPTIGTREAAIADAQTATGERVNQFGPRSAGAAEAPEIAQVQAALSTVSPELRSVIEGIPVDKANIPTIMRHIEADSLPVPIRYTEGQATGDIVKLSKEQNERGKNPELAQRFNEQNQALVDNIPAIRETAAPDVFTTRMIENAESIIKAYKDLDLSREEKITAAYKALEDANGGQFPVDGKQIAINADAALAKKLKGEFLSPAIRSQLDALKKPKKGAPPMTFEQFEAMRTNLAAEIRAADRAGDGNRGMAASIVREAMENLPLAGNAGKLKPIADNARKLAKERFDALKADPAYNDAVNEKTPAKDYFNKYVIRGVDKNLQKMVDTFGRGSPEHQNLAAGTLNWLSDRAGLVDGKGNFSASGFNKALKQLDDIRNMPLIFDPKTATQLRTLGNVAGYTQFQPRGSFVNNSNTYVSILANKAAGLAEQGANIMFGGKYGIPVGSMVREKAAEVKQRAATKKTLEVGAGSRLSDIAKEGGK